MGDEVVGVWVRFMLLFVDVDTPRSTPADNVGLQEWKRSVSLQDQILSKAIAKPTSQVFGITGDCLAKRVQRLIRCSPLKRGWQEAEG